MKNLNWWLIKTDRTCAWALLICIFLYILSGYGMTKGVIDYDYARWLHLGLLPVVILIAFTGHVSLALRITFIRWGIWNKITKALLILIFAGFLLGFGYIEFAYSNGSIAGAQAAGATSVNNEKVFTKQELAKYNGLNGMPAYAAVDGIVYDLSGVFINGIHQGYSAGQDLSAPFHSQHMEQILNKYPVVGKFLN